MSGMSALGGKDNPRLPARGHPERNTTGERGRRRKGKIAEPSRLTKIEVSIDLMAACHLVAAGCMSSSWKTKLPAVSNNKKLAGEFRSLDLDYGDDLSSHRINLPNR